jgi:hypothetical protein
MPRLLFLSIALLLLACAPAGALERNSLLSEAELVDLYGDASDELNPDEAASLLLLLVNEERKQAGLGSLQQLKLASYMARRHAGEMVRVGYSSHYDTQGRNPVERYNRLGGTDYVQENLIMLELDWPLHLSERLVRSFHREWMDSPGHRAAVLSPQATHLGSAFELEQLGALNRMAGVCEFISERGDYSRLPQRLSPGETMRLSGQLARDMQFGWISVGLQDHAQAMDAPTLNELPDSYSLPEESLRLLPYSQIDESQAKQFNEHILESDAQHGSFQLELRIPRDWAAQTAYFYIYAVAAGDTEMRCIACQTIELED